MTPATSQAADVHGNKISVIHLHLKLRKDHHNKFSPTKLLPNMMIKLLILPQKQPVVSSIQIFGIATMVQVNTTIGIFFGYHTIYDAIHE